MNTEALKQFQRENCDWNGHTLKDDGAIGPKTRWALAMADLPLFRRQIWSQLQGCFGQRETNGPNRSPWIDRLVLRAGGKLGDPWCAAFVYCMLQDVGVYCKRTVSSVECLRHFPPVESCEDPFPLLLDLCGWENGDGTGHVFFYAGRVAGSTLIGTWEGNHNDAFQFCLRDSKGLQFRRVLAISYDPILPQDAAPVSLRTVKGTR